MPTTDIDISIGLNLEIGSVPVSLNATYDSASSSYIFDGCLQDAKIDIGHFMSHVGGQFGVGVQLPPELNLKAVIDYVAGQVIHTKPQGQSATTEMGFSAKFTLQYKTDSVTISFYADRISGGTHAAAYVVGGAIETDLKFSSLPLVGDIPGFKDYTLKHLGFSYTNATVAATDKPVTFTIPKVTTSDNPLFTRGDTDPTAKDKNSYSIDSKGDQTTFQLGKGGFSFTAGLMKEGSDQPESNFALPMALPASTTGNQPAEYYKSNGAVQASPPDSPVHWININKTIGPLNLQKIGLNYKSGEATFGISAGLSVGGFNMDVQGLSITFPLPLPHIPAGHELSFDIQGLAMDFSEGGLTISGAFMKVVDDGFTNYFGEVLIQVAEFGFKAIGGYSPKQGDHPAAFFIYADLEAPLGGPPFLYVTGIAFGFGINYGLVLPTIDNLATYPLLPHNALPQGNAKNALTAVIQELENKSVIINEPGEYWVAAGVQFTSFDMVTAFAMITVSFGVEMQVALIGSCSIVLPEGDPYPLASIEVDLIASITPSTGLFAVEGIITPASFILGPFVKLSGGFALLIWFGAGNNPKENHKGDFVVTLGGYHPSFVKPANYPAVPRIELRFNLGPLQASGSSYIALTPSMFMAGMQFLATLDAGPLKAWFGAGVDFLIGWAPFQYEADAYVNIGCSLDLGLFTITINIGADLQLWGPPFGGKAELDLVVFTVTVHFGSEAAEPAPVSWQNMEDHFLPNAASKKATPAALQGQLTNWKSLDDSKTVTNVSASVSPGLAGHDVTSQDKEKWNWLVDPDHFVITTATTIPANKAVWMLDANSKVELSNDPAKYGLQTVDVSKHPYLELSPGTIPHSGSEVWNLGLNVKPMMIASVISQHTITLRQRGPNDGIGVFSQYKTEVAIEPVLGKSNTALWGVPVNGPQSDPNTDLFVPDTLMGFQIIPLPRNPDTVNSMPLYGLLFAGGEHTEFTYTAAKPVSSLTVTSIVDFSNGELVITISGGVNEEIKNKHFILKAFIDSQVVSSRNAVLTELNTFFNTYPAREVTLTEMGTAESLTDWPLVEVLGKPIAF